MSPVLNSRSKIYIVLIIIGLGLVVFKERLEIRCVRNAQREVTVDLLPDLLQELDSPFTCINSIAALQIQKLGSEAEVALPRLIELAQHKDEQLRIRAVAAIGYIGRRTDETDRVLLAAVKDKNTTVRFNAIFGLRETGSEAAAQVMLEATRDPERSIRANALASLRQLPGASNEQTRVRMEELLGDKDPKIRGLALEVIRAFQMKKSAGTVARLSTDSDSSVRKRSIEFLFSCCLEDSDNGDSENLAVLRQIDPTIFLAELDGPDPAQRIKAAEALARVSSPAVLDQLKTLITTGNVTQRSYAARALWQMGEGAAPLKGELLELLRSRDPMLHQAELRATVLLAVGETKPQGQESVAMLASIIANRASSHEERAAAAFALGKVGAAAKPAVPVLLEALKTSSLAVTSAEAIYALGEIGDCQPKVSAVLERESKSDNLSSHYYSRRALQKLNKPLPVSPEVEAFSNSCPMEENTLFLALSEYAKAESSGELERIKAASSRAFYADTINDYAMEHGRVSPTAFSYHQPRSGASSYIAKCPSKCRAALIVPNGTGLEARIAAYSQDEYKYDLYGFVFADNGWKFDGEFRGLGIKRLDGEDKRALADQTVLEWLSTKLCALSPDQGKVMEDGRIPGRLALSAYGVKARLAINGVDQAKRLHFIKLPYANTMVESTNSFSASVAGGLVRGKNRVTLNIEPIKNGPPIRRLSLQVFANASLQTRSAEERPVFDYLTFATSAEPIELEFAVKADN